MTTLRDKWLRQMERTLEAVSKLEPNDQNGLEVLPPASREEIVAAETVLGRKLPDDLVWFFSEISAGVDFYWSLLLTDLPEELRNVLAGQFRLSLAGLRTELVNWSDWEDRFLHPEDYDAADLDYAFEQVFPLLSDMGGDIVILVTDGPHRGNVVYLNHEDESFDRAVLGPTLQEFLDTWIALGCPGPDYGAWKVFYDTEAQRLSKEGDRARQWRGFLGL